MTLIPSQLLEAGNSVLAVIDMQTRLAAAVPEKIYQATRLTTGKLLQAAGLLDIPVLVSEQYPKGLGNTDPALRKHLPQVSEVIDKTCFSAFSAAAFAEALEISERHQVILCGMEAHICVLQTALQLQAAGYQMIVVEDAVCARHKQHFKNAMARLRQAGITVSNYESVLYEWLGDANHPHFKAIAALIR